MKQQKKKSISSKSLSLDRFPFVSVQLPGKVVSGKAPVAFKSQHWAFPVRNMVHYLCARFQGIRLACASLWKAWFSPLYPLWRVLKFRIFIFCSSGAKARTTKKHHGRSFRSVQHQNYARPVFSLFLQITTFLDALESHSQVVDHTGVPGVCIPVCTTWWLSYSSFSALIPWDWRCAVSTVRA